METGQSFVCADACHGNCVPVVTLLHKAGGCLRLCNAFILVRCLHQYSEEAWIYSLFVIDDQFKFLTLNRRFPNGADARQFEGEATRDVID